MNINFIPILAKSKYIFFIVLGTLITTAALVSVARTNTKINRYTKVSGTVVENISSRSSKGGTTARPVIEYALPDGTKGTFTNSYSTNVVTFNVGDKVGLYLNPENTSEGYIDSWFFKYGIRLFFIVFGLMIAIPSIISFRRLDTSLQSGPLKTFTDLANGNYQNDPELANAMKVLQDRFTKK